MPTYIFLPFLTSGFIRAISWEHKPLPPMLEALSHSPIISRYMLSAPIPRRALLSPVETARRVEAQSKFCNLRHQYSSNVKVFGKGAVGARACSPIARMQRPKFIKKSRARISAFSEYFCIWRVVPTCPSRAATGRTPRC